MRIISCVCAWILCAIAMAGGPTHPDGTEIQIDIPVECRMRNIGSKIDRAGMCVTTSASIAANWCGLKDWVGLRDWAAKADRGGSWPEKHLKQIKQYADKIGQPDPGWAHYVGSNPAPFLDATLQSGRMACVSWMRGGHWLNLVHLDEKRACIMDNNGDPNNFTWMSRESVLKQINSPYAWVGTWVAPPPPPIPRGVRRSISLPREFSRNLNLPVFKYNTSENPPDGVYVYAEIPEGETYILKGEKVTLEQFKNALGTGKELCVTVIAEDSVRNKVLQDINKIKSSLSTGVLAQGYSPDDWAVKPGFQTKGNPSIYVQRRDGLVLHRQEGYEGGSEYLGRALRRSDPAYDPSKDPDLSKPGPGPSPKPGPVIPTPVPVPVPVPTPAPPRIDPSKPLRIVGPTECVPYRLIRLDLENLPDGAAVIWDVSPEDKASMEEVGNKLLFTGPPGEYKLKVRAIILIDGRTIVLTARTTVVIAEKIITPPKKDK